MSRAAPARALACALALTGCSFAFVKAPPPTTPARAVAGCTASPVAPIFDTAVAVLTAIGAVYFVSEDNRLGAAIESGFALGFGVSAVVGWRRVSRCRQAQAVRP